MIPRRFLLYLILLVFLVFVAVKANFIAGNKYNGFNVKKANTSMSFSQSSTAYDYSDLQNVTKPQKYKAKATSGEEIGTKFLSYPVQTSDGVVYKNLYKIEVGGKYGLVNDDARKVTKTIYDDLTILDKEQGLFVLSLDNKKGLMNYKGKILIPTKYEGFEQTKNKDVLTIKNHKYYGLQDYNKAKLVVAPIYSAVISSTVHNWILVSGKKYGFINYKNGNVNIIKPKYDKIDHYVLSYTTTLGNKVGLIDEKTGNIITEPIYDTVELINPNDAELNNILIFRTRIDNRYGIIYYSDEATTIISPIYNQVEYKGLVNVLTNGYWRILDNKGNVISKAQSAFAKKK